jgi:iron complex outermembrane receptor protein
VTTGTDNFAFYADGFVRDSDDYEIPVEAESHEDHDDHDEHDDHDDHNGDYTVENSAEESYGFTFGSSYLFENGFVGLSVEKLDRQYGIPGHSHGDEGHEEDEHDDDDHDEEHDEEHSEENVFADLKQTRIQILSEFDLQNSFINQIKLRAGLTDYEHAEIEEGQTGTVFENQTQEFRIDALHQPFKEWRGGLSLHYKNSESSAEGEEAFTPPSDTSMLALALMEERHFGDVLLQLGGRIERVTLKANDVLLSSIELHAEGEHEDDHDEHDDEHEGDHDEHEGDHNKHGGGSFAFNENYTPISLSAGAVWSFAPEYNVGISVSHSERAPSAAELFSFGAHIGTGTYEVGALFELHEEDDETHIELSDMTIELETSHNIDLTFRKTEGDVGFIFNVFYNSIDNYLYEQDSGLVVHVEAHDHGEHSEEEHSDEEHSDEEDSHEEGSELPLFLFNQQDVVLNGFEAQVAWQVNSEFKTEIFADFVRARLKDGGNLPQTSPMRFGTKLSYQNEQLSAHLDVTRYHSQQHTAEYETSTDGYTMLDLSVSYDIPTYNLAVYFKGNNLTDTEARVHTSYLKDLAPRPGRNLSLGVKGYF